MKVKPSFRAFMQKYYGVDIFGDTFQRLTPSERRMYKQRYFEFIRSNCEPASQPKFNHHIKVDSNHTIHMTQDVFEYYKAQGISRDGIMKDVERMLDEFDVIDYKDCYISIKKDGSWNTKFEGGDYGF